MDWVNEMSTGEPRASLLSEKLPCRLLLNGSCQIQACERFDRMQMVEGRQVSRKGRTEPKCEKLNLPKTDGKRRR